MLKKKDNPADVRERPRVAHGPGSGLGLRPITDGWVSVPDRARDTQTDEIVALKKVRMDKEKDGEQRRRHSAPWGDPQRGACLPAPASVCVVLKCSRYLGAPAALSPVLGPCVRAHCGGPVAHGVGTELPCAALDAGGRATGACGRGLWAWPQHAADRRGEGNRPPPRAWLGAC